MNDFEKTDEIDSRPEGIDTKNWKRCPFCKGEPRAVVMNVHDDGWGTDWTGIVGCHVCEVRFTIGAKTRDEVIAEIKRRWQSRAERTCHVENMDGQPPEAVMDMMEVWLCSECGSPIYNDTTPTYCPYCGAKVVDEWAGK